LLHSIIINPELKINKIKQIHKHQKKRKIRKEKKRKEKKRKEKNNKIKEKNTMR
jgi:hypothetical protein